MHVIITIPAYNEEQNLRQVIDDIRKVMQNGPWDSYAIHVQDDYSADRTRAIADELADHAHTNEAHSGLAETFRQEMKNCLKLGADIIVHTDADGQYPAECIPQLISKVQEGNDLVVGSRFLDGKRYGNSKIRGMENIWFSTLVSLICGRRVTDITSGFRAMNRKVAELTIRSQYTYTYEQYIQSVFRRYAIAEIPITGAKTRKSKLARSALQYGSHVLMDFIRYYHHWRRKHD